MKKLQEEADKEWEKELARRKEQELNDEAIAKELQAQLEQEQQQQQQQQQIQPTPPPRPPPLPLKPQAYNQLSNSPNTSIAPLYSLSEESTSSLPPSRSYLPYKPSLTTQITSSPVIQSPTHHATNPSAPRPSVNPTLNNNGNLVPTPRPSFSTHQIHLDTTATATHKFYYPDPSSASHAAHADPSPAITTHPVHYDPSTAITAHPVYPKSPYHAHSTVNQAAQSLPLVMSMPEPIHAPVPPHNQTHSEPNVLPLSQPYQTLRPPTEPIQMNTHQPIKTLINKNNPYYKPSDSFLSLKPNQQGKIEEEQEPEVRTRLSATLSVRSDDSGYDYSDMVYVKNNERMMVPENPFADTNAIKEIQILDPLLLSHSSIKEEKEEVIQREEKEEEMIQREEEMIQREEKMEYEEKERMEERGYSEKEAVNEERDDWLNEGLSTQKVYPTNILRAGAPVVDSTDYGYYQVDKTNKELPKLPKSTNKEDRHITVASLKPGQRVWIRIHPTDTGKTLAERIHIVASYQTRRVTKITTKNGRNIPLDNTALFEDWNEILLFEEGESWTVEWTFMDHPYLEKLAEGKEWMKQLKASFKS
ncbi:hypothetical protein G6F57_005455 [Rhizopus arrhizus]|uniref:Uncharacterized protein n=1 Tax=Rhizopus oryzae TaxID=64495 RepID=A0A9P6XFJ0_RHIOR|nr:hypothetical protein G6F30_004153 [Rhizopus arrhizus]KAG1418266.1 hypothetical protein G6F58_005130 [Rhizopus delemar]KAG0984820.1 hypothetical protein G6F29_004498 [Rhizopus arrhizus]KAG0993854.1 hypothetical protein G6F28_006292 [Rhizopus arrhizus]KAG1013795.1 hypothetical protein G6F27_001561 [Rhizopus arrhizus]